jgi:subtilisin family serine protease
MQQLQFHKWTKSRNPLFAVVVLVAGCGDLEPDDVEPEDLELRDQDQAETGGADGDDDLAEPDKPNQGPKGQPGVISGHYIVMLKKGANPHAAAAAVNATPKHVFTSGISGFAGELNPGQLQALANHQDVVRIEPDQVVTAAAPECPDIGPDPVVTQPKTGAPYYAPAYSIDRVDQRDLPLGNSYIYSSTGKGVNVYIVDTWLMTNHSDLVGRASAGYDGYPNEPSNGEACSGHATHVAGIVGGTKYGVAKNVNLISVEVLDCSGHGSWSRLLAGIDWIKAHKGNTPAVANMSLGGNKSSIVNAAIDDLADSGVFVAVAAGNDNKNACNVSPAGADNAMTVAASNSSDQRASFSNFGSCVDIFAGGTNVRSAWSDGGSRTGTGTSMASPHVAGVAALYKQTFGNRPWDEIKLDIESWASEGKIQGNVSNTPNRLLHWPCSASE